MRTSEKLSAINRKFIIFAKLCKEDSKTYSLEHAATKARVDLKKLKKWVKTEVFFQDALDMCQWRCAINVGRAFSNGHITRKEAEQYLEGVAVYPYNLDFFVMKAKEDDQKKEARRKLYIELGIEPGRMKRHESRQ